MSAQGQMSVEENKLAVQRFWNEVFGEENLNAVDELFAPEWVLHADREAGFNEELRGPAAARDLVERIRAVFSELRVSVEEQLNAEADQIVTRFAVNGTYEGNPVDVKGLSISQVSGGKIAGSRLYWESGLMYEQIGDFAERLRRPPWK